MNNLDQESKQFIKWCSTQIDEELFDLIYSIQEQVWSDKKLIKKLKAKMVKGALEHGPINYQRNYRKELENEALDMIGWTLQSIWVKQHDQGKGK